MLLLYLPLRWLARGWLPPVTLVSQFLPFVLALGVPAGVVAWRLGRRRSLVVHAAAVVALAGLVAGVGRYPAETARVEPGVGALRVVTFNLADRVSAPERVVEFLRACDADVVALEELSPAHAELCERELADLYPHRALYGLGIPGSGILSRTPILDHERLALDSVRRYLVARVAPPARLGGPPLTVVVVHAPAVFGALGRLSTGGRDLDRLAALTVERRPALLVGDLNTTEFSDAYRRLARAGLVDAFRSVRRELGFTFPLPGRYHGLPVVPLVRIDYVWHTPDLVATGARVGEDAGSDHLPLAVELGRRSER